MTFTLSNGTLLEMPQTTNMHQTCKDTGCQLGTLRTCCDNGCERQKRAAEAIAMIPIESDTNARGVPCVDA